MTGDAPDPSPAADDPGGDGERPTRAAVSRTYDTIAEHFSATREYPWPEVTEFLGDRSGELGVDVGCGNGRHLPPLLSAVDRAVGVDASAGLLSVAADRARERGYADRVSFAAGDAAGLPIRTGVVDLGVYVATLHHLPRRASRVRSLDELARVLASDGRALVGVWSVDHDRFDRPEAHDTLVDWTLPGGETVPRFYHVYDREEFAADLRRSALAVERTFRSSGNCYAVVAPA